jgi:hypothetical protein
MNYFILPSENMVKTFAQDNGFTYYDYNEDEQGHNLFEYHGKQPLGKGQTILLCKRIDDGDKKGKWECTLTNVEDKTAAPKREKIGPPVKR